MKAIKFFGTDIGSYLKGLGYGLFIGALMSIQIRKNDAQADNAFLVLFLGGPTILCIGSFLNWLSAKESKS